jgi:hypothetical protein
MLRDVRDIQLGVVCSQIHLGSRLFVLNVDILLQEVILLGSMWGFALLAACLTLPCESLTAIWGCHKVIEFHCISLLRVLGFFPHRGWLLLMLAMCHIIIGSIIRNPWGWLHLLDD